jgi:sugar diacid utilization regulator
MKKISLKMVGLDGNAFAILGAFRRQALREGWTASEVEEVLQEAKSSDYSHLMSTIASHCQNPA